MAGYGTGNTYYGSASHFATNESWEVQRTNHFSVQFIDSKKTLEESVWNNLSLAVEAVKIPSINLQTTELRKGNEAVKVATAPAFDNGDITIKDAIGADIEQEFYAWFCKVYDPDTGLMGLVKDYKKEAKLIQYSPDGSVKRTWHLYGVFPITYDAGQLNYASPDKKMISSTLSVDKALREAKETEAKKKEES